MLEVYLVCVNKWKIFIFKIYLDALPHFSIVFIQKII